MYDHQTVVNITYEGAQIDFVTSTHGFEQLIFYNLYFIILNHVLT